MRKCKVCYVINGFINGGVETIIYGYIKNINKTKVDVILVSYDLIFDQKAYEKFRELGIKIYLISYWKTHFLKQCREMVVILKNEKVNIVHAHLNDLNWIPLMISKYCHVPVRISHSHMACNETSWLRKLLFWEEKNLIQMFATDYFACGQEASKMFCVKKSRVNEACYIMHNAIEVNAIMADSAERQTVQEIKDKLGLKDKFVVGHIGRFSEQKNHRFVINVFKEFNEKYENSRLLLIGTGELLKDIKKLVREKGIEDKVIFYGTSNQVGCLYETMDAILFPSLYEGLPVVCIEAQIVGIPLLVSDTVTSEVKINSNLKFLSLDEGIEKWCSELLLIANERKKQRLDYEFIRNIGFDITTEAEKLQVKYEKLLEVREHKGKC